MFSHRAAIAVFLLSILLFPNSPYFALSSVSPSPFRLPVMPEIKVAVTQGNNQGDHIAAYGSQYAFDFAVGQSNFVVTAAQGGTIIGLTDTSTIQCNGLDSEISPKVKPLKHCWAYANFVLIADDDGKTAALYVHLLPYSDKVQLPKLTLGEHVDQGTPIGFAGSTGYSTGVHLHFQVESLPSSASQQSPAPLGWWWTQSIPVAFANAEVWIKDACLLITSHGIPKTGQCFVASKSPSTPPQTIDTALHAKTNPYPPYTGQLVLDDPLSHDDGQWKSDPVGLGPSLCVFQKGKYILTAMKDDGGEALCPGNQKITGDFTFQVEITFVSQSSIPPSLKDDGAAGINFSPENPALSPYFFCLINQQGVLSLEFKRPDVNGFYRVTRKIPGFKEDQPHLLAVVVVGGQVTVYVNLVKELTETIPNLGQGHMTLEVDFGEYSYFPSAVFQNAKLWM